MVPSDLLQKSQLLTTLRRDESYSWLSPDALLIVRRRRNRKLLWKLRAYITKHDSINRQNRWWNRLPYPLIRAMMVTHALSQRDIRTGKETPFAEFNRLHSASLYASEVLIGNRNEIDRVELMPPKSVLSPDRRWILWKQSLKKYRAATLDGTEAYAWEAATHISKPLWLPGSRRWVEVIEQWQGDRYVIPELRFKRIGKPEYERVHTVSGFEDGLPVGMTKQGTLLVHHPNYRSRNGDREKERLGIVEFTELDLCRRPLEARQLEIRVPPLSWNWDISLSPDNNRLGWILEHFGSQKELYGSSCLWVSNRDGSDLHRIGATSSRKSDLQWSLDGKYLSFQDGENLYAVPVDGT